MDADKETPPGYNDGHAVCFRKLTRPITISMQIFGLYFEISEKKTRSCRSRVCKTYCVVTLVLLWMNVLRYIPSFFIGADFKASLTVFRIIVFVWIIQGTVNATILFYGCRRCIPLFCDMWFNFHCSESFRSLNVDGTYSKQNGGKKVFVWTAVGWTIIFANIVSLVVLSFGPNQQARELYGTSISNPAPATTLVKCIALFVFAYASAAWIMPLMYHFIVTGAIGSAFDKITYALRTELDKSAAELPPSLESLRKSHNQMCHLVRSLDYVMSLWIMNAYITTIPSACFILYTMVNSDLDVVTFCVEAFWLLSNILYTTGVSLASSKVTVKAHSALEHIYDINLKGSTTEDHGQLNLFLAKLNGPSIGFTALGLITVTREVILTLAGLYLTYFFLLLQFKI